MMKFRKKWLKLTVIRGLYSMEMQIEIVIHKEGNFGLGSSDFASNRANN
jgi:hypothetical protein